jgi:hypothetical protein
MKSSFGTSTSMIRSETHLTLPAGHRKMASLFAPQASLPNNILRTLSCRHVWSQPGVKTHRRAPLPPTAAAHACSQA